MYDGKSLSVYKFSSIILCSCFNISSYTFPIIGETNVKLIDLNMVLKFLESIWNNNTGTAKRLRGRIENILD